MSITRDEIADVCRAHDKFMIEAREWLRSPPVSEPDDPGIVYKEYDNSEPAPAPVADADWSGWERWLRAHLNIERRGLLEALEKDIADIIAEMRKERDAELLKLRAEVAELKGRTDVLISLLQTKGGDVVDLPQASWRRDRA